MKKSGQPIAETDKSTVGLYGLNSTFGDKAYFNVGNLL